MSEREREVFTAIRECAFGSHLDDPRMRAAACWLDRREKERDASEKERRRMEALAPADAASRLWLIFADKVKARSEAKWDEYVKRAPTDELQAILDTDQTTDADLEAIIWPEEAA